jgi:GTPase involved in cell partitioning and DNA repair
LEIKLEIIKNKWRNKFMNYYSADKSDLIRAIEELEQKVKDYETSIESKQRQFVNGQIAILQESQKEALSSNNIDQVIKISEVLMSYAGYVA